MEVVLGVSMTPAGLRTVLVEGDKADGAVLQHDVLAACSSPLDSVVEAVLRTRASAEASGHQLVATGVMFGDDAEAAALRDALTDRQVKEDIVLVPRFRAASALAQAVGRALGYDSTALMCIDRGIATLLVVGNAETHVVSALSRSLHGPDAMAVLAEMGISLKTLDPRPEAMFLVGSGVDIVSVRSYLEYVVPVPTRVPQEPALALARGAALAAANASAVQAQAVNTSASQAQAVNTSASQAQAVNTPASQAQAVNTSASQAQAVNTPAAARKPEAVFESAGRLVGAGFDGAALDATDVIAQRKTTSLSGTFITAGLVVAVMASVISVGVAIHQTTTQQPLNTIHNPVRPNAPAPPASTSAPGPTAKPPAAVGPPPAALPKGPPVLAERELPPPRAAPTRVRAPALRPVVQPRLQQPPHRPGAAPFRDSLRPRGGWAEKQIPRRVWPGEQPVR